MTYNVGGWLTPGVATVTNTSGQPEPILTAEQWVAFGEAS